MKSLDKLTDELQVVEFTRNANLFHSTMDDLLGRIGFSQVFDAYGISVRTWDDANGTIIPRVSALHGFNLKQLEAFNVFIEHSRFPVERYSRIANFKRGDALFDIATFYDKFASLKDGIYDSRFVASNSKLNSMRPVVDYNVLKNEFPPNAKDGLLDFILEQGGILKKGNFYFFNPNEVLELVSLEPKTFYVNLVRKDGS